MDTNLPAGSAMPIPIFTFVPDLLKNENTFIKFVYKAYYAVPKNTATLIYIYMHTPLNIFIWKTLAQYTTALHSTSKLSLLQVGRRGIHLQNPLLFKQ